MFRELVAGVTFHITELRASRSDSIKLDHCALPLGEPGAGFQILCNPSHEKKPFVFTTEVKKKDHSSLAFYEARHISVFQTNLKLAKTNGLVNYLKIFVFDICHLYWGFSQC